VSGSMKNGLGGDIAQEQDRVLASPYEGLPSPVIGSAWETQLELEDIDDPDLEQFIGGYRQGAQTPGPVAGHTGGVGESA
jgi:uncharacterized protein DUF3105